MPQPDLEGWKGVAKIEHKGVSWIYNTHKNESIIAKSFYLQLYVVS